MYYRRDALSFSKVIHQISRSQGTKKSPILTRIECFRSVTSVWIHRWIEMIHKTWCSTEEVPYYFSRSYIKFQGHTGWKIDDLDQIWARLLGRSQLSNPSDLPCCTFDAACNRKWLIKSKSSSGNIPGNAIGTFFQKTLCDYVSWSKRMVKSYKLNNWFSKLSEVLVEYIVSHFLNQIVYKLFRMPMANERSQWNVGQTIAHIRFHLLCWHADRWNPGNAVLAFIFYSVVLIKQR